MAMAKHITIIFLFLLAFAGCKSRQSEFRTIYKTDTITQTRIDTLRVVDYRQWGQYDTAKVEERKHYLDSTAVQDTTRVIVNADGSMNTERVRYITRYVGSAKELNSLQTRVSKYRDSLSVFRAKCDSLTRIKDNMQVVEKVRKGSLHWWQKLLMWLGVAALVTTGVMTLAAAKDKRVGRKIVDYICKHEDGDNQHK